MKFSEEQTLAGVLDLSDRDLGTIFGGWEGEHHGGDRDDEEWDRHGWGHHHGGYDDWNGGYPFFRASYSPIFVPAYYGGPSFEGGPSYYGRPSYYGGPGCAW